MSEYEDLREQYDREVSTLDQRVKEQEAEVNAQIDMNIRLVEEREVLAAESEALRAALEESHAANPCDCGWQVKAYDLAGEALAAPSLGAEVLRKRDAKLLQELVDRCQPDDSFQCDAPKCIYDWELTQMIEELEKP